MIISHKYIMQEVNLLWQKKVQQIKCGITHAIVGYCLVEKIFITF
jgi:hypothetical protein